MYMAGMDESSELKPPSRPGENVRDLPAAYYFPALLSTRARHLMNPARCIYNLSLSHTHTHTLAL